MYDKEDQTCLQRILMIGNSTKKKVKSVKNTKTYRNERSWRKNGVIPKNSLTIAAEPRRVIMSLVTVLAAMVGFEKLECD